MIHLRIQLHCPHTINGKPCKGVTLTNGRFLSVVCAKCGRVYYIDLKEMKTWAGKPQPRQGRR